MWYVESMKSHAELKPEVAAKLAILMRLRDLNQLAGTLIVSEFLVKRSALRVDLLIGREGELTAFEVKSERDTLRRLEKQTVGYLRYFDRFVLVVHERHLVHARSIAPDRAGLWVYGDDYIRELRRPMAHKPIKESMLHLLPIAKVRKLCGLKQGSTYGLRRSELEIRAKRATRSAVKEELSEYLQTRYGDWSKNIINQLEFVSKHGCLSTINAYLVRSSCSVGAPSAVARVEVERKSTGNWINLPTHLQVVS